MAAASMTNVFIITLIGYDRGFPKWRGATTLPTMNGCAVGHGGHYNPTRPSRLRSKPVVSCELILRYVWLADRIFDLVHLFSSSFFVS